MNTTYLFLAAQNSAFRSKRNSNNVHERHSDSDLHQLKLHQGDCANLPAKILVLPGPHKLGVLVAVHLRPNDGVTHLLRNHAGLAVLLCIIDGFLELVQSAAAITTFRPGWHLRGDVLGNLADAHQGVDGVLNTHHCLWIGILHLALKGE